MHTKKGLSFWHCGNGKIEAVKCNTLALDLLKNFAMICCLTSAKTTYTEGFKGMNFVGYSPFQI